MVQPDRSWVVGGGYRYGFNGKESDNEISGNGNQYDYGFRIYNPRIARFLSEDPLTKDYPSWSPYPFAMNRPIDGIDLDGLEWQPVNENGQSVPIDSRDIANYEWVGMAFVTETPLQRPNGTYIGEFEAPMTVRRARIWTGETSMRYFLEDGKTVEVHLTPDVPDEERSTYNIPDWMVTAWGEYGVTESAGAANNPRIQEYHGTTNAGARSPDATAWCSSFVNWVIEESGRVGDGTTWALNWRDWGIGAGQPVYGGIGVKTRQGGGHVGFIVGATTDKDGNTTGLYLLGGNQGTPSQVRVSWYEIGPFIPESPRLPADSQAPATDTNLLRWQGAADNNAED